MATTIIVRRQINGLVPVTPWDHEQMEGIKIGQDVTATLAMARSTRHNAFYWALLGKVVENHPFYRTSKALHVFLKTRLGYVDEVIFHDGEVRFNVQSTAFDKMPRQDWKTYFDAALQLIIDDVLPGVSRRDLLAEVSRMLGVSYEDLWQKELAAA